MLLQNNHVDTKQYEGPLNDENFLLQNYLVLSSYSTFISPAYLARQPQGIQCRLGMEGLSLMDTCVGNETTFRQICLLCFRHSFNRFPESFDREKAGCCMLFLHELLVLPIPVCSGGRLIDINLVSSGGQYFV